MKAYRIIAALNTYCIFYNNIRDLTLLCLTLGVIFETNIYAGADPEILKGGGGGNKKKKILKGGIQ